MRHRLTRRLRLPRRRRSYGAPFRHRNAHRLSARLDRRRGLGDGQSLHFRGAARSRRSAACRTAISTTSRCRRTGTPATACSKRRASTRSPIWNGARPQCRSGCQWRRHRPRPHRHAERADRKDAAVSAQASRASISISPSTGRIGARAACGWAISRCCRTPSTGPRLRLTTHNGGKACGNLFARRPNHRSWRAGFVPGLVHPRPRHDRRLGGDRRRQRRVCASTVDRQSAPLLGLLHAPTRWASSLFCQLALSALELDDTRKPACLSGRPAPLSI